MPKQSLANTEMSYIKDNFQDKTPKEMADHLGLPIRVIRETVESLEKAALEVPPVEETPVVTNTVEQLKERPQVMKNMKGKYEGGMVMTPEASERGDDFSKRSGKVSNKFSDAIGKIYKDR